MNDQSGHVYEGALRKPDIAARFRVAPRTIDNWMRLGMPHYRLGKLTYFDWPIVEEWIRTTRTVRR